MIEFGEKSKVLIENYLEEFDIVERKDKKIDTNDINTSIPHILKKNIIKIVGAFGIPSIPGLIVGCLSLTPTGWALLGVSSILGIGTVIYNFLTKTKKYHSSLEEIKIAINQKLEEKILCIKEDLRTSKDEQSNKIKMKLESLEMNLENLNNKTWIEEKKQIKIKIRKIKEKINKLI